MRRPSRQSCQQRVPRTHKEAENWAFNTDRKTGLNVFGAPLGYLPANVVDEFDAWDEGGKLLWVLTRDNRVEQSVPSTT